MAALTPASSHHVKALRASALPIVSVSPPTAYPSPGIDCAVKELAGQSGRGAFAARREDRMSERESMQYDVVIVGAGPAGLTAAIRLKQLAAKVKEVLEPHYERKRAAN
jgi:NADPH-dependent 2,4-dienoyl-CoA reductase/sulfur reductase-like enzyme